jgi:HEPN domain-containing protein
MSETTPDYPAEFHARLLFYAEADLRAAESLLQEAGPYWHKPCFEAREAAEKALKAFLEASGNCRLD